MRKMTKAYQLKPMTEQVMAYKFEGHWYPMTGDQLLDKEIFIPGKGWKKITKTMTKSLTKVEPLQENWTAADIQDRARQFSLEVAEGLLQGWGRSSLFNDGSVGLSYAKHELANMSFFGKIYDDFTDKVHEVGQRFIRSILKKGYWFQGSWMWYKNKVVGMAGPYEKVWLHPTQHIEHLLSGIVHVRPMFDPIGFEKMLIHLIAVRRNYASIFERHISVKDRIKFLTTQKIAEDFEKIFEWQKAFNVEVKNG